MAHSFVFSGPINTPPRSSSTGAAIVISVVAVLSLAMVLPDATGKWALAALALLLPLAITCKAIYAVHIALLALVWVSLVGFVPFFRLWPLNILAPLAVYGGAGLFTPPLWRSLGWLCAGGAGRRVRLLITTPVVVVRLWVVA